MHGIVRVLEDVLSGPWTDETMGILKVIYFQLYWLLMPDFLHF
jgi:hypothetical protein